MKRIQEQTTGRERGRTLLSAFGLRVSALCARVPALCARVSFILSAVFVSSFLLLTGCDSIDQDLSECGYDYELNYELMLVTNLNTELNTELDAQADVELAAELRKQLAHIFSDFAHDVDLSFYDTEGAKERLQHDQHVMDANQASYTLYLPMREYMHLAVANIAENSVVNLVDDGWCNTSKLHIMDAATRAATPDTIDSHDTGLFSARLLMNVLEGVDQTFNVHLYMANCASALIVDTTGVAIKDLQVYATGFASAINLEDSTFVFDTPTPVVRTNRLNKAYDNRLCFYSVSFPSREEQPSEAKDTRLVIETTDPFVSVGGENALWEMHCYVTLPDGSVTRTVLGMNTPLRAGQLKIIKVRVDDDGAIRPMDSEVSTSVTLKWKEGLEIEG